MRNSGMCLDSQLWHACAGGMVQMPPLNSKVFYFPQGHAEHANGAVDFGNSRIPSLIPCRVSDIRYLADPDTDEVFAKMRLVPLTSYELDCETDPGLMGTNQLDGEEKPASFAKTLTQSDANNGGGFSVPRYCAETIFPRLDYNAEPPVQNILAKDVHGGTWKFRHIYRGTPRRHLLTTGWSNFVNQKKLVAGDSVVFLRAENGDLCVGLRRAKRGIGGGSSGWNLPAGNCTALFGGCAAFMKEEESKFMSRKGNGDSSGRIRAESVVEAATLAAMGKPFEVVYYPCAGTPEFCVKASGVRAAMQVRWFPGMRFKMPFETEDSSRISWFMGTISSVQVADPIFWPDSPWRLLQVTWDEPELLQNVKRVNPWLVEVVASMPAINVSPFSPPRKKMRIPQHAADLSLFSQPPIPSFAPSFNNPTSSFLRISEDIPAGIQGARHAQIELPSAGFQYGKLQLNTFPEGFQHLGPPLLPIPDGKFMGSTKDIENLAGWLTVGVPAKNSVEKETRAPHILLFGQVILPDKQNSKSCSVDMVGNSSSEGNPEKTNFSDGSGSGSSSSPLQNCSGENSSDGGSCYKNNNQNNDLGLEAGHCKVFMESEDVGRIIDLSVLGSYEELHSKLASVFGVGSSEMPSSVVYRDAIGAVKNVGDEPFSEFLKTARRLTIPAADSGSDNIGM